MPVTYLYDGSWEGLLSCIFAAYADREQPEEILPEADAQLRLEQQIRHIATDPERARRVEAGIVRQLGHPALDNISVGFLSQDVGKGVILYNYVRAGFAMGRRIYNALAHDAVLALDRLNTHTVRESHQFRQFTRFSLMEGGVYFGRIAPKNNVLPLIMPYFADRFTDQPFLLWDTVHGLAGVYDTRDWRLAETDGLQLPPLAEEELEYRRLWKQFYHSVAVAERYNPSLRRNHMPKRYWANLTEFMADKAR